MYQPVRLCRNLSHHITPAGLCRHSFEPGFVVKHDKCVLGSLKVQSNQKSKTNTTKNLIFGNIRTSFSFFQSYTGGGQDSCEHDIT